MALPFRADRHTKASILLKHGEKFTIVPVEVLVGVLLYIVVLDLERPRWEV